MNIGERLRYLREQNGISGKALAEKIGLVPSQINKIEHGVTKPSIDSLERICSALNVTLSDFFASEAPTLAPSLSRLLQAAERLTEEERQKLTELLNTMKGNDQ